MSLTHTIYNTSHAYSLYSASRVHRHYVSVFGTGHVELSCVHRPRRNPTSHDSQAYDNNQLSDALTRSICLLHLSHQCSRLLQQHSAEASLSSVEIFPYTSTAIIEYFRNLSSSNVNPQSYENVHIKYKNPPHHFHSTFTPSTELHFNSVHQQWASTGWQRCAPCRSAQIRLP